MEYWVENFFGQCIPPTLALPRPFAPRRGSPGSRGAEPGPWPVSSPPCCSPRFSLPAQSPLGGLDGTEQVACGRHWKGLWVQSWNGHHPHPRPLQMDACPAVLRAGGMGVLCSPPPAMTPPSSPLSA